jgi:hypothetical protein
MNSNLSHSTGFIYGQFYTLSNPPLSQPASFAAATNDSVTTLAWTDALFPKKGASKAGYLLLYSTSMPSLQQVENGKAPGHTFTNGHVLPVSSTALPYLPAKKAKVYHLSKDSTYYFLLIPYTWNGVNDSTYNYLTQHALSVTINQAVNVNNFNSNEMNAKLNGVRLFPNPVKDVLHLKGLCTASCGSSSLKTVSVIDASGKLLEQTTTANSGYSFTTKQLSAGIYFVRIDQGSKTWTTKFIKD